MNLVDCLSYYKREIRVVTSGLLPAQEVSSEKGSPLKEKNLLSRGANSFLL